MSSRKLTEAQIFNMDESGLPLKATLSRVHAPKDIWQVSGQKKQLERVTFGLCSNDGSLKLPVIVMGKSKKRQCLKHLDLDNLPV